MFHFHKYKKLNKKVFSSYQESLAWESKDYTIYDLYSCTKCKKVVYSEIYTHHTYSYKQSIDFEEKLLDLNIESNMDYMLKN